MSQFIGAFEVTSKLTGQNLSMRFSTCGTACDAARGHDRHRSFLSMARRMLSDWRTPRCEVPREGWRDLTDREASFVAAGIARAARGKDVRRSTTWRTTMSCA